MKPGGCCPYTQYYENQAGGGIPVFIGRHSQSGHGLSQIFSSLGRVAIPFIRGIGGFLGRQALNTGVGIGQDILEGRNWHDSARERFKTAGKNVMGEIGRQFMQRGTGRKRKGKCCTKKTKSKAKRIKTIATALD